MLRFHELLAELAADVDSGAVPAGTTLEGLLQGPLADAMTPAGQLAMLRRLAGSPVPLQNFVLADIRPERSARISRRPRTAGAR